MYWLALLLFSLSLYSCNKEDHWKTYTIQKGQHSSGVHFKPCLAPAISFKVKFNNTCQYDIGSDQGDINKLYGFSEGDHRKNSARIGWRWYHDSLQIFGYTHVDSKFYYHYITSVYQYQEIPCSIIAIGDQYHFTCNGIKIEMARSMYYKDERYYLFPYFGGNIPSPHQVTIEIQE